MCFHVAIPGKLELQTTFPGKGVMYQAGEIYHVNGFSRPFLPVELNSFPDIIQVARWKLIPSWVRSERDALKYANTLNAEAETIFERTSYKNYIGYHRGLLYVNGFYEPHKVKGVKETENYFIFRPKKQIFTLGIVFSDWEDKETGVNYPTFSIITTPANSLLTEVHNVKKRMPLIIPADKRKAWLSPASRSKLTELMAPYRGELKAHKVFRVTGARGEDTNRPEIQDELP